MCTRTECPAPVGFGAFRQLLYNRSEAPAEHFLPWCPLPDCRTTPAAAANARGPQHLSVSLNAGFSELGSLCQSQAPHSIFAHHPAPVNFGFKGGDLSACTPCKRCGKEYFY